MSEELFNIIALGTIGIMVAVCVFLGIKEIIRAIQCNKKTDKGREDLMETIRQIRSNR